MNSKFDSLVGDMRTLAQYIAEIIGAAWIVIVAAQYLCRYFLLMPSVDFTWAYIGMLAVTLVLAGRRYLAKTR